MKHFSRKLAAGALAITLTTTCATPAHAGSLTGTAKGAWDAAFFGTLAFGNVVFDKVGSSGDSRILNPTDSFILNGLFQGILIIALVNAAIFGIGTAAAGVPR